MAAATKHAVQVVEGSNPAGTTAEGFLPLSREWRGTHGACRSQSRDNRAAPEQKPSCDIRPHARARTHTWAEERGTAAQGWPHTKGHCCSRRSATRHQGTRCQPSGGDQEDSQCPALANGARGARRQSRSPSTSSMGPAGQWRIGAAVSATGAVTGFDISGAPLTFLTHAGVPPSYGFVGPEGVCLGGGGGATIWICVNSVSSNQMMGGGGDQCHALPFDRYAQPAWRRR